MNKDKLIIQNCIDALEVIAEEECYCEPNPEYGYGPCGSCIATKALIYNKDIENQPPEPFMRIKVTDEKRD